MLGGVRTFRRIPPALPAEGVSMPIVMKLKDKRSCPTVVCDVCRKEIKDARDGNAQWMMGEAGGGGGEEASQATRTGHRRLRRRLRARVARLRRGNAARGVSAAGRRHGGGDVRGELRPASSLRLPPEERRRRHDPRRGGR